MYYQQVLCIPIERTNKKSITPAKKSTCPQKNGWLVRNEGMNLGIMTYGFIPSFPKGLPEKGPI